MPDPSSKPRSTHYDRKHEDRAPAVDESLAASLGGFPQVRSAVSDPVYPDRFPIGRQPSANQEPVAHPIIKVYIDGVKQSAPASVAELQTAGLGNSHPTDTPDAPESPCCGLGCPAACESNEQYWKEHACSFSICPDNCTVEQQVLCRCPNPRPDVPAINRTDTAHPSEPNSAIPSTAAGHTSHESNPSYSPSPNQEPATSNPLLPTYYNAGDQDLIALAFALGKGADFCAVNVAKYALRYDQKDGLKDLRKARVYLDRLIAHIEQKAAQE